MRPRISFTAATTLLLLFFNNIYGQVQPKTLQQISLLLQEKGSRTPNQQKIQSQLLQAISQSKGKQIVEGLKLKPVNVRADIKGNLNVDIDATVTTELLNKIQSLGGKIIYPSTEYNTIRATVNLSNIDSISSMPEVKFIRKAVRARTVGMNAYNRYLKKGAAKDNNLKGVDRSERDKGIQSLLQKYLKNNYRVFFSGSNAKDNSTGLIVTEGDRTHRADDARNLYGYTGKGIKIGVLSDSYNATGGAATDVLNGDLPGTGNPLGHTIPVTVAQDYLQTDGTDEGRAMLQIVHDVAPDAQLFFATGNISEASFANNIKLLRNTYKCDIIIDDLGYFDEPAFQDGIIAQAVNTVTAAGAMYFSSAGNDGCLAKGTSGVFEGDFNNSGSPLFDNSTNNKLGTIHNFGTVATPLNGDIITLEGSVYTLQWADAAGKSGNDYDLFLVGFDGSIVAFSDDVQNGNDDPIEIFDPPADGLFDGDRLVVFKSNAAATRAFNINTNGGMLTKATNGQTFGHNCAISAFGVAATPATTSSDDLTADGPYPKAFNSANQVEDFSSDGPRRIFYTPTGTAITAGNFLFGTNGGQVLQKPDITAADGVSTNVTNSSFTPFFGTSAAAPHAGAIAALLKSANPSLTAAQIRTILTSTALDVEAAGYDNNSGYGIIQAFQAMQQVSPVHLSNVDINSVKITEGSSSNGNGAIDPGETGAIFVRLINPSLVIDSNVTSSIKSTTSGVTITQGTASYGNLSVAATGNATFSFTVSSSVPCGTVINFIDTVRFGGGGPSPQIFMFSVNVGAQPDANITSSLGAPPPTSNEYTSKTGIQTGRLNRQTDGTVSTCSSPLTNPGVGATTGSRRYDSYKFINNSKSSQCVTVIMDAVQGDSLFCVTYNDSGYVPAAPGSHFLADGGNSFTPEEYSFNVAAGKSFTVVIHAVDPGTAVGSSYNLNVSLSNCSIVYVFNGNGNWNVGSNWLNGTVPPNPLSDGYEILIDPVPAGECILNIAQTISTGAKISVQPNKKFRIIGNLQIQP